MAGLDDFKNLNTEDPGSWPWSVKIVTFVFILVVVISAGAYFDWKDQWENFDRVQAEEQPLKDTFVEKKKVAINLDLLKKQYNEIKESFGAMLRQLPSKSEMDALLTDVNQAGLARGLQFELFRPSGETVSGSFAEQPIAIKVTGNYDDFGHFASDVSMLPRIVTLNDIKISPEGKEERLSMEVLAKTFRYMDEEGEAE